MMTAQELHPLAREVPEAFATQSYFRSHRFTYTLAERSPTQCVRWAFSLIEPFVNASTPHEIVTRTLSEIQDAIVSQSAEHLPELDELSRQSWCSGSFSDESPFAQRAVARLGWASILMIGNATGTNVESKLSGIHISANGKGMIRELANQCAMALDMIYTNTHDGRLMVAAAFSREMAAFRSDSDG